MEELSNIREKAEKEWEQRQIAGWKSNKKDVVSFFNQFEVETNTIYEHITNIDYNRMQIICYLLSKIKKVIKICEFLDNLEKNDHEDVDVIKIFLLISHAEITMRNFGEKETKLKLVKKFFEPINSDLKCRIKPTSLTIMKNPSIVDFIDVLYKIRCQYAHEGEYIGRIFKENKDDKYSNIFPFKDNMKQDKDWFFGECGITYLEFLKLYIQALVENIKIFSGYKN